jgi:hypothetical protein
MHARTALCSCAGNGESMHRLAEVKHARVVVNDGLGVGLVEARRQVRLCCSKAHCIADALTQGTCTSGMRSTHGKTHDMICNPRAGNDTCDVNRLDACHVRHHVPEVCRRECPHRQRLRRRCQRRDRCCLKNRRRTELAVDVPVVTSTPAVTKFSGWPGVLEPNWRNCLMSSICTHQARRSTLQRSYVAGVNIGRWRAGSASPACLASSR